eukprot:5142314-Pyramimonas_sp.AAC.2
MAKRAAASAQSGAAPGSGGPSAAVRGAKKDKLFQHLVIPSQSCPSPTDLVALAIRVSRCVYHCIILDMLACPCSARAWLCMQGPMHPSRTVARGRPTFSAESQGSQARSRRAPVVAMRGAVARPADLARCALLAWRA